VHGHLCHYRLARLIKFSFYKNIMLGFVLFYYQFYCGFSGAPCPSAALGFSTAGGFSLRTV
jgi:magnesium-transporting ATPase (P-type)